MLLHWCLHEWVHILDYCGSLWTFYSNPLNASVECRCCILIHASMFCDWRHPFLPDRRRKMKRPTLRSATNPTTSHSQQPVSPKEMAPTSPCLQWRPRSVDHCSASPGLGRGLREQHMGVVLQWVGFTHSRRLFCYPKGGGGWTQAPVNTDTAFLTKHSWLCPAPSLTCTHLL